MRAGRGGEGGDLKGGRACQGALQRRRPNAWQGRRVAAALPARPPTCGRGRPPEADHRLLLGVGVPGQRKVQARHAERQLLHRRARRQPRGGVVPRAPLLVAAQRVQIVLAQHLAAVWQYIVSIVQFNSGA
jgi:hypothetical protein